MSDHLRSIERVENIEIVLNLFQLAAVCLLLLSVAGYFGKAGKYLELASHFRLQYAILSFCCLLIFVAFETWYWIPVAALSLLINMAAVLPSYFPTQDAVAPGQPLRVMQANVLYENTRYASFVKLVLDEKPDILVAQEVTDVWLDELGALREAFPHAFKLAQPRGGGIALYSRFPLLRPEAISLGHQDRPAISARLEVEDTTVSLFTFHTHAPLRRDHFGYRNSHLRAAAELIKNFPAPLIVIGDFNTTRWSPYFEELVTSTGLLDTRRGFGLLPTWPVWLLQLPFLMLPIDHCLTSNGIRVRHIRTRRIRGSDHHSLIVDLLIPRATEH